MLSGTDNAPNHGSKTSALLAHAGRARPGFCSVKWRGFFFTPSPPLWMGCYSIAGLPPASHSTVLEPLGGESRALWDLSVLPKNTTQLGSNTAKKFLSREQQLETNACSLSCAETFRTFSTSLATHGKHLTFGFRLCLCVLMLLIGLLTTISFYVCRGMRPWIVHRLKHVLFLFYMVTVC